MLRDTDFANATVLTSCWLDQATSTANQAWIEQDMIVRILAHVSPMVLGGNHRCCRCGTFVSEKVRKCTQNYGRSPLEGIENWEHCR